MEIENKDIDTTEAIKTVKEVTGVGITLPTMILWANKKGLGRKLGGRWKIDRQKLLDYLKSERWV